MTHSRSAEAGEGALGSWGGAAAHASEARQAWEAAQQGFMLHQQQLRQQQASTRETLAYRVVSGTSGTKHLTIRG